jgi:hypothetical protein
MSKSARFQSLLSIRPVREGRARNAGAAVEKSLKIERRLQQQRHRREVASPEAGKPCLLLDETGVRRGWSVEVDAAITKDLANASSVLMFSISCRRISTSFFTGPPPSLHPAKLEFAVPWFEWIRHHNSITPAA